MERDAIEMKVRQIFLDQSCGEITADQVKPESKLFSAVDNDPDRLDLDSLDRLEVVMAVEEEFSLEFPDDDLNKVTTVKEFMDLIESKINEKEVAYECAKN